MEQKEKKNGMGFWKKAGLVVGGAVVGILAYKNRDKIGTGLKACGNKIKAATAKKIVDDPAPVNVVEPEVNVATESVGTMAQDYVQQPSVQAKEKPVNGNFNGGYKPRYVKQNEYRNN